MVGRYLLGSEIASGGMATVHLGRLLAEGGFSRTVAIKRLHAHLAKDREFVSMFLDEARLASRIRHPNVVMTLDVVIASGEIFLILEYVHGESLRSLTQVLDTTTAVPPRIAAAIFVDALLGLHATHEARDELGDPLNIVHRDVSPQNIMVGVDGVARILDFGIAKATMRLQTTRNGHVKGKLRYMAPEQVSGRRVTRRTDIFACGAVLWEALTGKQLFESDTPAGTISAITLEDTVLPSRLVPSLPKELDAVVSRALSKRPEDRFESARAMAEALEQALQPASRTDVGQWVESVAADGLRRRALRIAAMEADRASPEEPASGATGQRGSSDETGHGSLGPTGAETVTDAAVSPKARMGPLHWNRFGLPTQVAVLIALVVVLGLAALVNRHPANTVAPLAAPVPEPDASSAREDSSISSAPGASGAAEAGPTPDALDPPKQRSW